MLETIARPDRLSGLAGQGRSAAPAPNADSFSARKMTPLAQAATSSVVDGQCPLSGGRRAHLNGRHAALCWRATLAPCMDGSPLARVFLSVWQMLVGAASIRPSGAAFHAPSTLSIAVLPLANNHWHGHRMRFLTGEEALRLLRPSVQPRHGDLGAGRSVRDGRDLIPLPARSVWGRFLPCA